MGMGLGTRLAHVGTPKLYMHMFSPLVPFSNGIFNVNTALGRGGVDMFELQGQEIIYRKHCIAGKVLNLAIWQIG